MQIIQALWPVFALLVIGAASRKMKFPGEPFWPLIEKFVYFVCFPALLVTRLAAADFSGGLAFKLALAVSVLVIVAALIAVALQSLLKFKAAAFTSVFQGGLRFNTYIALAVAATLLPGEGVVYAAIIASVMIPLLNLFCVMIFAIYQENRPSAKRVVLNIIQNPLILACALGLVLNLSGLGLPWVLSSVLELLAQVALPLGIVAVGAALDLRALRTAGVELAVAVAFRLMLMPVLAFLVAFSLGLSPDAFTVFLVFASVPCASAAYILARQLGGDAPLMSGILSAQTLISMLTLPIVLSILPALYLQLQ